MITTVLIIGTFGLALARLHGATHGQPDTPEEAATALTGVGIPEDLWSAFDAVAAQEAARVTRTTVGGMTEGSWGFVSMEATQRDAGGGLWLDAAAVVHPSSAPGRVRLHRDPSGYRMHRGVDAWATPVGGSLRARVRIAALFD